MKLDQWHKQQVDQANQTREAISNRAVELAKSLGVTLDDPKRMELLHSLAIAERTVSGQQAPRLES